MDSKRLIDQGWEQRTKQSEQLSKTLEAAEKSKKASCSSHTFSADYQAAYKKMTLETRLR